MDIARARTNKHKIYTINLIADRAVWIKNFLANDTHDNKIKDTKIMMTLVVVVVVVGKDLSSARITSPS